MTLPERAASDEIEPTALTWRTSSFSGKEECVEVADEPDRGRLVRDSKDPNGPTLHFTPAEWQAFIAGVKAGEFD